MVSGGFDLGRTIADGLPCRAVQYGAPAKDSKISTVAICAGSGGSMFKDVKADLYWTGEMSHVSDSKDLAVVSRMTLRRSPLILFVVDANAASSAGDYPGRVSYRPLPSHEHGTRLFAGCLERQTGERVEGRGTR